MKRTNIYLQEDQYKKLARLADKESKSVSELIRTFIDAGVQLNNITYLDYKNNSDFFNPFVKKLIQVNRIRELKEAAEAAKGIFTDEDINQFKRRHEIEITAAKRRKRIW